MTTNQSVCGYCAGHGTARMDGRKEVTCPICKGLKTVAARIGMEGTVSVGSDSYGAKVTAVNASGKRIHVDYDAETLGSGKFSLRDNGYWHEVGGAQNGRRLVLGKAVEYRDRDF